MDGREWQEFIQETLLDIQKTNQEQMKMLGEVKACINSIKKQQDRHEQKLKEHDKDIEKLRDVQTRHSTYFKLIGAAISFVTTLFASLSFLREYLTR